MLGRGGRLRNLWLPAGPLAGKGPATETPLSAWGDNKRCPVCGETIKAIAVRCRYCHTDFDTVDPLTMADLHRKARKGEKVSGCNRPSSALFVLTLIGCLAPLALVLEPGDPPAAAQKPRQARAAVPDSRLFIRRSFRGILGIDAIVCVVFQW